MFNIFKSKKITQDLDDEELKKQGFDPLNVKNDTVDSKQKFDFSDLYRGYQSASLQDIMNQYLSFQYHIILNSLFSRYPNYRDEYRHQSAHQKGGIQCMDQRIIRLERNVAKDLIKQIGRKLISGDFNLTRIPFPVSISLPKSALEAAANSQLLFPLYMNVANMQSDPMERFKLAMVAFLGSYSWTVEFLKPLNPILGETLEGSYNDGSQYFAEQISHHPPITYFQMIGPNQSYTYHGTYDIHASAGLNSLHIRNAGKRTLTFKHGQVIKLSYPNESYNGTFLGDCRQVTKGSMVFEDTQNKIYCKVRFGKESRLPEDHLFGEIVVDGQHRSTVSGSYLTHIDFDDIRYWDIRTLEPHRMTFHNKLQSDHQNRLDIVHLKRGELNESQLEKNKLEEKQRSDAKLREISKKSNKHKK